MCGGGGGSQRGLPPRDAEVHLSSALTTRLYMCPHKAVVWADSAFKSPLEQDKKAHLAPNDKL